MGKVVKMEGVRGISPPDKTKLSEDQLIQTVNLSDEIATTLEILRGAKKLGVERRSSVLSKLVKSQEALVKTQRLILGMDTDSGGIINKGVIIIPGKAVDWPDAAKREIDSAKRILSTDEGLVVDSVSGQDLRDLPKEEVVDQVEEQEPSDNP